MKPGPRGITETCHTHSHPLHPCSSQLAVNVIVQLDWCNQYPLPMQHLGYSALKYCYWTRDVIWKSFNHGHLWMEWGQAGNIRDLTVPGHDIAAKFQWNSIPGSLLKAFCVPSAALRGGDLIDPCPAVAQLCWGQDMWRTPVSASRLKVQWFPTFGEVHTLLGI